jgi:hypothetical protein
MQLTPELTPATGFRNGAENLPGLVAKQGVPISERFNNQPPQDRAGASSQTEAEGRRVLWLIETNFASTGKPDLRN